jgi:hypothetical protein
MAVNPFIPAYILGKKLKSNPSILTLKSTATTIGTTTDTAMINLRTFATLL